MGIHIRTLIVNRLLRGYGCMELDAVAGIQADVLEEFKASFGRVRVIENVGYEPSGREDLLRFYDNLRGLI